MYQVHIFSQPRYFIVKGVWKYAKGFVGNSMFFGTLLGIGVSISGSIGCIVSVYLSLFFIIIQSIFLSKDKGYDIILVSIMLVILTSILLIFITNNKYLKKDINELKSEYNSLKKGEVKDSFGTGRIYIWKNTINKSLEKHGIGVGIDNFALAFDNKLIDTKSGYVVDKAHNEYLQNLLCQGIIYLIVYIYFIGLIFIKGFKRNLSCINYGLYISFITYSIQAIFNISVTRVAPI